MTEWTIAEIARLSGLTSRALRHYDRIGLLTPSRASASGYRFYDQDALVRLQRILLLRELGLGLARIGEVLHEETDAVAALTAHLAWLQGERGRIERQIASVQETIDAEQRGDEMTAEHMLDGFDHTQYKDEVEERWGAEAYATSDTWWRTKTDADRAQYRVRMRELMAAWTEASERGLDPASTEAQALARRQYEMLSEVPGLPGFGEGGPTKSYIVNIGEMYVADPRFGRNYGGEAGAIFVRDAMRVFAEANLG